MSTQGKFSIVLSARTSKTIFSSGTQLALGESLMTNCCSSIPRWDCQNKVAALLCLTERSNNVALTLNESVLALSFG
jgi:hypothetical protein